MSLDLCYYGNPVLRETAEAVTSFSQDLADLADEMVATMHHEAGIGLAGPQIGKSLRIFVMEIPAELDVDESGERLNPDLNGPLVVVNPQLLPKIEDQDEMEEGCLSIPDIRGRVTRPYEITLNYQTVSGGEKTLVLKGLAARCAQHELDHLNGVLFLDHLSPVKRMAIKGKLKKLKEKHRK